MPPKSFAADEASKACLRGVAKLLSGHVSDASELILPPALELASAGAIVVIDSRHRVVHLNRNAAELAGSPAESLLGRECRDVFRCVNCPAKCPLFGGAAIRGREVRLSRVNGPPTPVLKNAEVVFDDAGALVGGFEVMHDLTNLRPLGGQSRARGSAVQIAFGRPSVARGGVVLGNGTSALASTACAYGMVGNSPAMRLLFDRIGRLARVDAPVLVGGESGTGKELVARALHDASPRSKRPFHAINCAALSPDLLESELFGHERGAFTGAVRHKPGRFEVCEDGTVLLDEIGCLPYALQSKLLRVLEDGGFERVGGTQRLQLRARVIAATNADLEALVKQGSFRADLLYRLKICVVTVPPLRERETDVPVLAEHFATTLAASCGARFEGFSRSALCALRDHPWPGNVRELRNVVHAALVSALDQEIGCEHLPPEIAGLVPETAPDRSRIEDALVRARFNRAEAALILGVSRTTLWRHMRRVGIP